MAETDSEQRDAPLGACFDHSDRHTGTGGLTGPGRDDDALGVTPEQLVHPGEVVADHVDLGPELAQVLDQVVRERIVVVDHQKAHRTRAQSPPSLARSIASISARALLNVSWYSASGSESATMPPPDRRKISPSFTMSVRIAMAMSMLPE